ncbi:MAG: heme ABC transporter permease [Pseudomonadota bacterium]
MGFFTSLANPNRFSRFTTRLSPFLIGATLIAFAVGLYMAFFVAPEDYQQGQTVRIMFVHVPAAWLAMFCYTLMTASAIGTLVWKHPLADVSAKAAAPLGAMFTLLALVTGSLWGKPMWGTWWVWDARLTSVLVLFLMYLGLIALWNTIEEPGRAAKVTALTILVGFINIPIIKFSVDWWNTLHQPASVIRVDGPTIHPDILIPLLVMALAFTLAFLSLHMLAMRNELMRRRVRRLQSNLAHAADLDTVPEAAE